MKRHPLQYFCSLCILIAAPIHGALAQCASTDPVTEMASGLVYLDANRNSIRDAPEIGIPGVSVSNGCDVVATDNDGSYSISIQPNGILFISQPSGYTVAVDENNIPQFFYRHYPTGTPTSIAGTSVAWQWPVIEATGPLPDSIDFGLNRLATAATEFSAHGFADTQARYELGEDMLREDLVTTLIGNPYEVLFGLTVGDVVFDNLDLYQRHKQMMALMDIPQWYLPGNHDINYESPNAGFANETYKLHFGPVYYSFNYGNVHFVALNNVEYAGAAKTFGNQRYRGFIPARQLTWLQRDLAAVPRDKLIVIATHIPLLATATDATGAVANGPGTENFSELLRILEPFEHLYGLAGHDTSNSWKVKIDHSHGWGGQPWIAHTLAEVRGNGWNTGPADLRGVRDAMMQDGNPNGFYLLRFDDVTLVPEFIPFPYGPDAARGMRITLDPLLTPPEQGSVNRGRLNPGTRIVVNLFDGGERDSVSLALDESDPLAMTYRVRTDPYVQRIYDRLLDSNDAIGRPTRSAHIWEYQLPDTLAAGIHRVEVTSADEFGQARRASFSFEVLAD